MKFRLTSQEFHIPPRYFLDPLLFRNGKRLGFEVKYTATPKVTTSQHIALEQLNLDALTIVCPGCVDYPLDEKKTHHRPRPYRGSGLVVGRGLGSMDRAEQGVN